MKRKSLFTTFSLLLILTSNICASESPATRGVVATPGGSLPSHHYMTALSSSNFRAAGATDLSETFTISNPGYYTLVQDVDYRGTATAITISSSNVTLDLGGRNLYGTNNTGGSRVINIAAGKDNIVIKNGHIGNFKDAGITISENCKSIRIENVSISNCTNKGINIVGTNGNNCSEISINNCIVSHTVATEDGTEDNAIGLLMDYCDNVTVSNSIFGTSTTSSGIAGGVYVTRAKNITFINCDTSSISATAGSDALGIGAANNCQNFSFINCTANNNRASAQNSSGFGFIIDGSTAACHGASFINCEAKGNTGGTSSGDIDGMSNGYGFSLESTHETYFENCKASYNNGLDAGYGFYMLNSSNNYYVNCKALGNQATGGSNTSLDQTSGGHGFYTDTGSGNTFEQCLSKGNKTTNGMTNTLSSGFFSTGETNSSWIDCEARSNGANTTMTQDAAGFYLGNAATGCIINGCKAISNNTASGTATYGFHDASTAAKTLIIDCLGFGNTTANFYLADGTGTDNLSINTTAYTNETIKNLTGRNPFENLSINLPA